MKKLPKAVLRTSEEMRASAAALAASQSRELSAAADAGRADAIPTGVVIEMPAKGAVRTQPPAASKVGEAYVTEGRIRAIAIVERHATYAAAGGLIPLPFVNVPTVTAIIVRMAKLLSAHYGVPFNRDLTRAMAIAMLGGASPTGLASAASSALIYLLPTTGLIGIAVSTVTAAIFTRGIGMVFIEHLESGAALNEFPGKS